MVHTAIIAFIIIGMMFFLTNNEEKHGSETGKVEVHEKKVSEHQREKVKSIEELDLNSKEFELLRYERGLKDAAIYKNKILIKRVNKEIEKEAELKKALLESKSKTEDLMKKAQNTKLNQDEMLKVLTSKRNMLNSELEKAVTSLQALESTNSKLKADMEKLVLELKNEKNEKSKSFKIVSELNSKKDSLEANLTEYSKHEKKLELEQSAFKSKIAELMATVEKTQEEAKEQQEKKEQKIVTLVTSKQSLEANLTVELEKENTLNVEKHELEIKIEKLLTIAKEAMDKGNAEHEIEVQKMQTLLTNKKSLEANLTTELEHEKELKAKITQLLATVNETTEKAKVEHNAEVQKLEALRLIKVNLESNLTAEIEHEKVLTDENIALKMELEAIAEAKAKEEAEKAAAKAKAKEEAEKAAAEAKAKEEAEKAAAEAKAKEEAEKAAVAELKDAFALTQVEFHNNSMNLTSKSKELLSKTAEVIKKHTQFQYVVQGHTDDRGNAEYNLQLSAKRANKVKEYLISQGVDASLLSSEGFGEEQPIADNATKAGRIQNRRVVFQVIK